MSESASVSKLTIQDFYSRLSEKVSDYNARLLMQSVVIGAGLRDADRADALKVEQAKSLCLELIKRGGPAFQVGKAMYHEVQ